MRNQCATFSKLIKAEPGVSIPHLGQLHKNVIRYTSLTGMISIILLYYYMGLLTKLKYTVHVLISLKFRVHVGMCPRGSVINFAHSNSAQLSI